MAAAQTRTEFRVSDKGYRALAACDYHEAHPVKARLRCLLAVIRAKAYSCAKKDPVETIYGPGWFQVLTMEAASGRVFWPPPDVLKGDQP